MRFGRASILIGAVLAASFAVAGIAGAAATAHHSKAAAAPTWTSADVAKVAKANGVPSFDPIYAVPKKLPKQYKLAFINPDLSNPFFATWSKASRSPTPR